MDVHQKKKHQRIVAIAKLNRGRVNYKEFLAEMQYQGIRGKIADEYIQVLKDLNMIKRDKEDFVPNLLSDYWKRFGLTKTSDT